MDENEVVQPVFVELKAILQRFESELIVKTDQPGSYMLITSHLMPNKQPLYFGGVQIMKNYISFHLIPVYACPTLLEGISDDLHKRTQRGFDGYKANKYV